jgi:hypothetical protein
LGKPASYNEKGFWRSQVMKDKALSWLNTALVIDLFLVLASFGWLAIAIVGETTGIPFGLSLWYKLWEPLFMPAIGILMAGALMSGAIGWVGKRLSDRKNA